MFRLLILLLILALAGLGGLLARPFYRSYIERDLTNLSQIALEKSGQNGVSVSYDHLYGTATGFVDELPQKITAGQVIDQGVKGAYIDTAGVKVIPKTPSEFEGDLDSETGVIVLKGVVSSEEVRTELGEAAKAIPSVSNVDNRITVGDRIATPVWRGQIQGYMNGFFGAKGDQLRLNINDKGLHLRGAVDTEAIRNGLGQSAIPVVGDAAKVKNDLRVVPPPPASFSATRTGNNVIVEGLLPSETSRLKILAAVRAANPGKSVVDQTQLGKRMSQPWWDPRFEKLLPEFFGKIEGDGLVAYDEKALVLKGQVRGRPMRDQLVALAGTGKPETVLIRPQLEVLPIPSPVTVVQTPPPAPPEPPAPEPAKKLVQSFKAEAVYFDSASHAIKNTEKEKISRLAKAIKDSGDESVILTVGGYADKKGNPEYNRALSLRRANAVRDRLIELGIPKAQLEVDSFGEETGDWAEELLWKSRRVELSVKKKDQEE